MFRRRDFTSHDEVSRRNEEVYLLQQERRERFEIANNFDTFWSIVADASMDNEYRSREMLSHLFSLFKNAQWTTCDESCDRQDEEGDSESSPNATNKREWLSLDFENAPLSTLRIIDNDIASWEKRKLSTRVKRMKTLRASLIHEAQLRSEERLRRLEECIAFL